MYQCVIAKTISSRRIYRVRQQYRIWNLNINPQIEKLNFQLFKIQSLEREVSNFVFQILVLPLCIQRYLHPHLQDSIIRRIPACSCKNCIIKRKIWSALEYSCKSCVMKGKMQSALVYSCKNCMTKRKMQSTPVYLKKRYLAPIF